MLISSSATTTASYLQIESNLTRSQAVEAADPTVKNATAYYTANIGKVTSISDFVNNYQLFSYAMTAYGLSDMTYAKGLMTKVLEGGITDSTSLANTMSDPRFKAFATAFDFTGQGAAAVVKSAAATTGTTSQYLETSLENDVGQTNQGVQLAVYFQRKASSVTNVYGILGDAALLKVVQTAFGISSQTGGEDIDTQATTISNELNIKDLQDPTKVQALVERFTAMWDASGNGSSSNGAGSDAVSLLSGAGTTSPGFSTNLMLSIAQLPAGGF
jgi:hypothetical protein